MPSMKSLRRGLLARASSKTEWSEPVKPLVVDPDDQSSSQSQGSVPTSPATTGISQDVSTPPPSTPGFALVEVFTSDLSRSGRAVDDLLARLASSRTAGGEETHALVFHVDHLDSAAARDPFGAPAFSARQRMYARVFRCEAFTPMAVVNGRSAVIANTYLTVRLAVSAGRRKAAAEQAQLVAAATPGQTAVPRIALKLNPVDDPLATEAYTLWHETQALPSKSILHLAVVQDELPVVVKDRRMVHNSVVRGFLSFFVPEGDSEDELPVTFAFPNADENKMRIIAYVSPADDSRIVAATQIPFPKTL